MPLDEKPINVQRSQSTKQHASKDASSGQGAASRPPPLAIQNMLKSTTETGDVGMFAQRPSRIPRSNTQSSLGVQSRRHRRLHLDHHPSQIRRPSTASKRGLTRSETVRTSQTAYQYKPRSRRLRPRPGTYPYQYSAYPPGRQHILHTHRSLASLRSATAAANMPSSYARSYHSSSGHRLGRAVSPALSNMYEYRNPAGHMSRHHSFGTAPSSPGSITSFGRSLRNYRSEHNGSIASLRPLPSPGIASNRYQPPRRTFSRNLTPSSAMRPPQRFCGRASLDSEPASSTGSIVPFYYDYSESFHGADGLIRWPADHPTIPEVGVEQEEDFKQHKPRVAEARDPLGTMPGSRFSPAELPTKHNRRSSEQSVRSRHSRRTSDKSNLSARLFSHAIKEHPTHEQEDEQHVESGATETQSEPESYVKAVDQDGTAVGRNSTNSPRLWPSPSSSTFFTNACRSPRNLTNLAAKAHSPELRDVGSIDAIATNHRAPKRKDQELVGSEKYRLATPKFRPLSMSMTPKSRSSTSRIPNVHRAPEIVSPRPERPTSSQSRKRFSKILDLDQNAATIETYNPGHSMLHPFTELERVDETASPARTPPTTSPHAVSTGGTSGTDATDNTRPAVTRDKQTGVMSRDSSTLESLLDRHIECLGLRPGETTAPCPSTCRAETSHGLEHIPELDVPGVSSTILSPKQEPRPLTGVSNRPTSLSSSAQRKLMPRRLFASFSDSRTLKVSLASSESDARFPLVWADEKTTPSIGWLPLPSESSLNIDATMSRQSLLSGDYADVESSRTVKQSSLRRHSSPSLTPMSEMEISTNSDQGAAGDTDGTLYRRSKSDVVSRKEFQDRKLEMHLRAQHHGVDSSTSDAWVSTDDRSGHSETELRRLGLTRAPISAMNGFAELSGESANVSQQSSTSILNIRDSSARDARSGIVAATRLPARQPTGSRRKDPVNTKSQDDKRDIGEPVDISRVSSYGPSDEVRTKSSVPRLSTPAFGPAMRVSQFDLAAGYQLKSPHHKKSSFSEPKELLQAIPTNYGRHSVRDRRRFDSLRRMMPNSIRSCTFSPQRGTAHHHQNITVTRACREEWPSSDIEQPSFPETVPMSNLAYRKHKLLEKVKECLPCVKRAFGPRRRRSVPSGGFLT